MFPHLHHTTSLMSNKLSKSPHKSSVTEVHDALHTRYNFMRVVPSHVGTRISFNPRRMRQMHGGPLRIRAGVDVMGYEYGSTKDGKTQEKPIQEKPKQSKRSSIDRTCRSSITRQKGPGTLSPYACNTEWKRGTKECKGEATLWRNESACTQTSSMLLTSHHGEESKFRIWLINKWCWPAAAEAGWD